jgi:hypothetical protein
MTGNGVSDYFKIIWNATGSIFVINSYWSTSLTVLFIPEPNTSSRIMALG